jgi:hypothetical protein
MNTGPQAEKQNKDAVLDQLDRSELLTLIKQMIQHYPDLALLVNALPGINEEQQRASFDPEQYRLKVEEIFATTDRNTWGSESRAAGPLLDIMQVADEAVEQHNFADAITLYELMIQGILDNYNSFRWHAEEGDLDTVVEDGVNGLNKCLLASNDQVLRTHIIEILCTVYAFDKDLINDEPVMSRKIPSILVRHTTSDERKRLVSWVRKTFGLTINWDKDDINDYYDSTIDLLLGLEADSIDNETFLRLCRETENFPYLIERLLTRGRDKEALVEAQQIDTYDILEIADIFCEQGYEADAEHLIQERSQHSHSQELLQWLQKRYQDRGDNEGTLAMACRQFCTTPFGATIERYREIHHIAEQLGQWTTVQPELLASVQQSHNISLQIEIALDEGQVKEALDLLRSQPRPASLQNGPYGGNTFEVGIEVAQAAEENYPQEAIEIYQKYIETRIAWRGRDNYHIACQYLVKVRRLFQKIGKSSMWTSYVMGLRGQHNNLPALKDEMAKAKI